MLFTDLSNLLSFEHSRPFVGISIIVLLFLFGLGGADAGFFFWLLGFESDLSLVHDLLVINCVLVLGLAENLFVEVGLRLGS